MQASSVFEPSGCTPADLPLRHLRRRVGRTAAEGDTQVGVHPMSVPRWERGERLPGPSQLRALAAALGVETITVARISDQVLDQHPVRDRDRLRAPGLRRTCLRYRMSVREMAALLNVPTSTRVGVPRHHLPALARVWGSDVLALLTAREYDVARIQGLTDIIDKARVRAAAGQVPELVQPDHANPSVDGTSDSLHGHDDPGSWGMLGSHGTKERQWSA